MTVLWAPLRLLMAINTFLLRIGRALAWMALGLMVVVILLQVFFRYIVGNALPWPDEAARFLMLWMTGLIAPSAYRWGGFVSIDMLIRALPGRIGALMGLILLSISLCVLVVGVRLGIDHVNSGWLFKSSTLQIPGWLTGDRAIKMPLAWMYLSLATGLALLVLVNLELMLKALIRLLDGTADIPDDPDMIFAGAD